MMKSQVKGAGFTLVEMLLVMVIVSMMIYMGLGYVQQRTTQLRIDRTSLQMQQILNAGMSYYISNGKWPVNLKCLQGVPAATCPQVYLPPTINSPWNQGVYTIVNNAKNLYVYTGVITNSKTTALGYAQTIAGKLPLAYVTNTVAATPPAQVACTTTTCYVVASVNIPGQNLNNATAINYAGIVSNGGCLPVPTCPVDPSGAAMTPEAIVVPISVSGYNIPSSSKVYPISSFTASVVGNGNPPTTTSPPLCPGSNGLSGSRNCLNYVPAGTKAATAYWRVCLQIVTSQGNITTTQNAYYGFNQYWGNKASIAAFTRCSIRGEPTTSGFAIYGN